MKLLIQRVNRAAVSIRGEASPRAAIGRGYLLLVGFEAGDNEEIARKMAEKTIKLRLFEDEKGKTNLSLTDVGGDVLSVSQFTLAAEIHQSGNRPSFFTALEPSKSEPLYAFFNGVLSSLLGKKAGTGVFGGDMLIDLQNDGPFTIFLDSASLFGRKGS